VITRDNFALSYSGYDATQPPPLGFVTHPAASHKPTAGRMHRAGSMSLAPSQPHLMADPSDPSTWQRPYRFTS